MNRVVFRGMLAGLLLLLDGGAGMAGDLPQRSGTPRPRTASPSFIVRQQLEAEVREVDRTGDVVVLKTKAGRLRLHPAGAATTTLAKGDSVVVDIALIRHADPVRVPQREEGPPPLIAQRLSASITSIQRTVEVVALNTSAGGLMLAVPSQAIATLHTGDSVWLDLAVRPEREPSALASTETRRRNSGFTGLLFMLFGGGK
jgi:hypothetical protein